MEHRGSFITGYTSVVVLLFASGRTQHHSSFSLYNFCVIQLFTGYMLMTPEVLVDFQLHINRVGIRIFENPPDESFVCFSFIVFPLRKTNKPNVQLAHWLIYRRLFSVCLVQTETVFFVFFNNPSTGGDLLLTPFLSTSIKWSEKTNDIAKAFCFFYCHRLCCWQVKFHAALLWNWIAHVLLWHASTFFDEAKY